MGDGKKNEQRGSCYRVFYLVLWWISQWKLDSNKKKIETKKSVPVSCRRQLRTFPFFLISFKKMFENKQQSKVRSGSAGFDWVRPSFTEFYWVFPSNIGVCLVFIALEWVLPSITGFHLVLLGFAGFYLVLLGFNGFYWMLMVFSRFYWVRLSFTGF